MNELAVVIGRFAPTHNAHVTRLLSRALDNYDHVLVLFGSSLKARDPKNPFTWEEREQMMHEALVFHYQDRWWNERMGERFKYRPIKDYPYSNNRWTLQVQKAVAETVEELGGDWSVTLVGNDKDESSFYLKLFPQWQTNISVPKDTKNLVGATAIRQAIYEDNWEDVERWCAPAVVEYLKQWKTTEPGQWITEEYHWHQQYQMVLARKTDPARLERAVEEIAEDLGIFPGTVKKIVERSGVGDYVAMPYKPIYHTCDNVVLWRGHVLLIERKARPGQGLLALPGGFLNPNEWILDGALREGEEESRVRIYLPDSKKRIPLTRAWQTARRTFDHPSRSLRGRIITDAFLWEIPDEFEVDIRAGDDAKPGTAKFYSLHEILNGPMDYCLFEDHQAIIAHMVL